MLGDIPISQPTEEHRKSRDTNARPDTRKETCPILPHLLGGSEVLLESALVLLLLRGRLEGTVTELGRRVDPFELHLLESLARRVDEHRLAKGHDPLLDTGDGALDHDEIVVDLAVTDEATQAANS